MKLKFSLLSGSDFHDEKPFYGVFPNEVCEAWKGWNEYLNFRINDD
jgi:hypothetical protein